MRRRFSLWPALVGLIALSAACGDSGTDPMEQQDPAIAPFVGTWAATDFTVTSQLNDTVSVNILANGSFTINVQPSGLYTATLVFLGTPLPEIGQLAVFGSSLTLTPTGETDPASSQFRFDGPDRLTLDGPTELDFNLDGTAEPGLAHIELERTGDT